MLPASPYARATWRLAPGELARTVLNVSHILITHEQSRDGASPLARDAFWKPAPSRRRATRSIDAARAVAARLARAARAPDASFSSLARQHSEDLHTADRGGVIGIVPARDLPASFLDALATLRAGEVSEPVPSRLGFHILKLDAPAEPAWLAGRELVISYEGTDAWRRDTLRVPMRSRAEAQRLAQQLAATLRANPSAFQAQVAAHSDRRSRESAGDFGVWSTTDPGVEGATLAALRELEVGKVSTPIDTAVGFRIVQRTEVPPPVHYRVARIELPYGDAPTSSGPAPTQAEARAQMKQIAADVARDPARFEVYQRKLCCTDDLTWEGGRGNATLTRKLAGLAPGAILAAPIDMPEPGTLGLYKKLASLETSRSHRTQLLFEVPRPTQVEFEYIVANTEPRLLVGALRQLSSQALSALALPDAESTRLRARLDTLLDMLQRAPPAQRVATYEHSLAQMQTLLGAARFAAFWSQVEALAKAELMKG